MTAADQYKLWYDALAGKSIDFPAAEPASGYWRNPTNKGPELVAIWRDENGAIHAKRSIYGDGKRLDGGMEIGTELGQCFRYPIPYALYQKIDAAIKAGIEQPWPPEYKTRLTMKEIEAGVMWTPALGKIKLGEDVDPQEEAGNPRAIVGGNNPPEELTEDQTLAARVKKVATSFKDFLAKIGGKIATKADADTAANFATKFQEFKTLAEAKHKVEKEPHLIAGREVDTKWFSIRDEATAQRALVLKEAKVFTDAEQARRNEEARIANEKIREANFAAERAAAVDGTPVEKIEEVKAEKVIIGTARSIGSRGRTIWKVTTPLDYAAYVYRVSPGAFEEVTAALQKIANRQKSAKVSPIPPGLTEQEESKLV